jgi:hypothetical protein
MHHFICFVFLYQTIWNFTILTNGTEFSGPKLWSVKLRKINISDTFFFTSSIEAPKLQRPSETFLPSTGKTLLLKEQPKNCLRASSKANLTLVTLRAQGSHVVHLVKYGGDHPLLTA